MCLRRKIVIHRVKQWANSGKTLVTSQCNWAHGAALSPQFQDASLGRSRPGLREHSRVACYFANNALRFTCREDRDRPAAAAAGDLRAEHAVARTLRGDELHETIRRVAAQPAGPITLVGPIHEASHLLRRARLFAELAEQFGKAVHAPLFVDGMLCCATHRIAPLREHGGRRIADAAIGSEELGA